MSSNDSDQIVEEQRELASLLDLNYPGTNEIVFKLDELRSDPSENGQFYQEHWRLIHELIAAGCGRRNLRTEAIKNDFLEKLRDSGASIAKGHARDLYIINNSHSVWLKCNTLTPVTTQYWNGWHASKYEKYGQSSVLILLCGNEQTAIVLPPETHQRYFAASNVTERHAKYDYYSTTVIPRPHCLELKIRDELINLNEYINNFVPIDVRPIAQMPTKLLVRAHFLASSILSSVQSFPAKSSAKIRAGTMNPRRHAAGLGDTMYAPHELVNRKIIEIRAFLAGSLGTRPSSETICYWVWFCYEFGLYQEGAQLFRKINEDLILRDLFILTRQLGLACEGRC